jgi:flavin prenyltransferase
MNQPRWIIGLSGASGVVYALRLIEVLREHAPTISLHTVASDDALRVLQEEHGVSARSLEELLGPDVTTYNNRDIGAAIASGSFRAEGMVVVPCSMATLAALSSGLGDNLLRRAAQVALKERRKLIVVPRETPLTTIDLENMLRLARAGAIMLPAMPGFYHQPSSVREIIDLLVMKIADLMGLQIDLVPRWGEAK